MVSDFFENHSDSAAVNHIRFQPVAGNNDTLSV